MTKKDLIDALKLVLITGIIMFFGAVIIWINWAYVIPAVFPRLVSDGYIVRELPFDVCFLFSCIVMITYTIKLPTKKE